MTYQCNHVKSNPYLSIPHILFRINYFTKTWWLWDKNNLTFRHTFLFRYFLSNDSMQIYTWNIGIMWLSFKFLHHPKIIKCYEYVCTFCKFTPFRIITTNTYIQKVWQEVVVELLLIFRNFHLSKWIFMRNNCWYFSPFMLYL